MELKELLLGAIKNNKFVGVLGLGISGVETIEFLQRVGVPAIAFEKQSEAEFHAKSKFVERVKGFKCRVCFGFDAAESASQEAAKLQCLVLSPGVSTDSPVVAAIRSAGVPIVGELELGLGMIGGKHIVVTGSNGKSTTVSLIAKMFRDAGQKFRLLGNIGTPAVSFVSSLSAPVDSETWNVVEASSYQLSVCSRLVPDVAVFLNLSENHLERHGDMQGYFKAKTHRFVVPGVKSLVTNADDLWGAKLSTANTIFTKDSKVAAGFKGLAVLVDYRPAAGVDHLVFFESGRETKRTTIKPRLLGTHNRLNIAAAVAGGLRAGLPLDGVIRSVESFTSLEHRIEMVRELDGVIYINDSKATTVAASGVAISTVLEAYPNRAVYILLGGLSKFGSWAPLLKDTLSGHSNVKLVFFGKDGEMIRGVAQEFGRDGPCFRAMADAVASAREAAAKDRGVVLFSPGCASFDAFKDFEDRGAQFKSVVNSWR